jgi:hypothetical protein
MTIQEQLAETQLQSTVPMSASSTTRSRNFVVMKSHLTMPFHPDSLREPGEQAPLGGRLRGAAIDEIAAVNEMMKANNE